MLKNILINEENLITQISELTDIFYNGIKSNTVPQKIGIEFEKLPIKSNNFKAVPYANIEKFLKSFMKTSKNWTPVYENNSILGLKGKNAAISLEPGSQTEISLAPMEKISEIKRYLDNYNKITRKLGDEQGIYWLGYGIQPVSTYRNISIIPKTRYKFMTEYLPTTAKKPLIMMRETSGIQTSIDYTSEEDAIKKLKLALKLSPIISAAFANSPVRNGRLTKFKSNRAASWLETDNDRCGLISSKIFKEEFSFSDYAEVLLDVPTIFIERNIEGKKAAIPTDNRTFRKFLNSGFKEYKAQKEDWELHLSLYFPDVRLKSYIEIRNHDNQRSELITAIPAFWKGLIYNNDAIDAANEVIKDLSYFEFEYLRKKTPKTGLNIKIKNHKLSEIAYEIMKISYESLKQLDAEEEVLLEPIMELTAQGLTPADLIIDLMAKNPINGISKLVEHCRL